MLQTAEAARAAGKPDWFQLVALVHDIGKIMYKWSGPEDGQGGKATDPQWALGGDTWVVGCRIPDSTVYQELNMLNPDMQVREYATETGIYKPGCGKHEISLLVLPIACLCFVEPCRTSTNHQAS
jgi:inositol oxygenase